MRIYLVHWNAAEAAERAALLRASSYEVAHEPCTPAVLRQLRDDPPAAILIDLSRIPSQGRDIALAVRTYKSLRAVPLVILEGTVESVARLRKLLPDAVYTTWGRVRSSLKRAIANPPANPVVPRSRLDGYAGAPLLKKLGIKPGMAVGLVDAPLGFEGTLGALPAGAVVHRDDERAGDLTIWFPRSQSHVERDVERVGAAAGRSGLWIAWPKKGSGVASDLSETVVRKAGLAAGLVDYKICAIDDTWSALRFVWRRRNEKEVQ